MCFLRKIIVVESPESSLQQDLVTSSGQDVYQASGMPSEKLGWEQVFGIHALATVKGLKSCDLAHSKGLFM